MKPFLRIVAIPVFALAVAGGSAAAAGPKRPLVTSSGNVMTLEYDFEDPEIVTTGDFDAVTINGFERYSKEGAPVIPVKVIQ